MSKGVRDGKDTAENPKEASEVGVLVQNGAPGGGALLGLFSPSLFPGYPFDAGHHIRNEERRENKPDCKGKEGTKSIRTKETTEPSRQDGKEPTERTCALGFGFGRGRASAGDS